MSAIEQLEAIGARHPEFVPWVRVLREVVTAFDDAGWEERVPSAPNPQPRAPLLAGLVLKPDGARLARLWRVLRHRAAEANPAMRALEKLPSSEAHAIAVFHAALDDDEARLGAIARDAHLEAEPLIGLAAIFPQPFLHACRRCWKDLLPANWREGYCPTCGAWPAYAELCGVERTRSLRCGRCGSGWQALVLSCPYCGNHDHESLGSLVAEGTDSKAAIETCGRCRGYVKAFTRLQAGPPETVMIDDLASVALDLAATTRQFARAKGLGHALDVRLQSEGEGSTP